LQRFLTARRWFRVRTGERLEEYSAPPDLGLPSDFRIAVPRSGEPPDVARFLARITDVLAELYAHSIEQVEPVLETADTVLSIQIDDVGTAAGSIGFNRFDRMLQELRNLILDTAAFVAEEEPVVDRVPPEAIAFLSSCRFLQTARGSFVASVQLPSEQVIRDASLLNPEPVKAKLAVERMSSVLTYVAESVLQRLPELFSPDHVQEHSNLVNLNVLEDVRNLFHQAGDTSLRFSFLDIDETRRISPGRLTADKTGALAEYVEFIRDLVARDLPVDVTGKVVELRSRNPQGNRNYVLVQAHFEHRPTYFAVTLNNELYGVAVHAHRSNRIVRIAGRARRMKTQMKIAELTTFAQA
jgi:hypothetical protein